MTACRAASTYPCPLIMHVTAAARRPAATLPVSQTGDGTWWIGLRSREYGRGGATRIATQRRHCFTDGCVRTGSFFRARER